MSLLPGTNRQLPDHAIMDAYNKQTYLGNQYSYAVSSAIAATSETVLILLTNPAVSTSSFPSGYVSLFVNLRKLSCVTAAQSAVLRCYISPTFSAAGSAKTPVNLRPLSPNTSIAALSTGPTVSNNGTLIDFLDSNTAVTDSSLELIVLDPGKTLLLTAQVTTNPTTILTKLSWYEL